MRPLGAGANISVPPPVTPSRGPYTAPVVRLPMKTLQALDKLLGRAACLAVQPLLLLERVRSLAGRRRARSEVDERILLIKFWGIGSLQLLTPACRTLRRRHAGARLTLLTLAENADFARGLRDLRGAQPAFDEVLTLDVEAEWPELFRRILVTLWRLRAHRFDVVFDFEFFTRFSAIASLACAASSRHGFHAPGIWRGGVHTRTVPFNRYWHVARNFAALAGEDSEREITAGELAPFAPGPAARAAVDELLDELAQGGPLIVLNPNAGRLSLERRWPSARFAALAARLGDERGATVLLVGSPSERDYTQAALELVPAAARARVHSLAGRLSIAELCALLARADLVVSNDSGPMHVAAALATPTIGLFGPETPLMYRPLGVAALAMWSPPICSPCINVHDNKLATCTHGQPECLMRIDVERVFQASCRMLDSGRAASPSGNHEPLEVLG